MNSGMSRIFERQERGLQSTSYYLSPQQIQDFYQVGYIVIQGLFTAAEIQHIKGCFDRLEAIAKTLRTTQVHRGSQFVVENDRIDRIVWMGAAEPSLLRYGEDPRILTPCSQILRSNSLEQLICQGHYKLPGDQVQFDWHQDCQHRGYGTSDWVDIDGRGSYVQTLMAIDEVTIDNGPVYFVPYTVDKGYVGLDKHPHPTELFDVEKAVPLLMQPGDVAFFSPYAIHGSMPNNSEGARRVFINGFAHPGANRRVYPGEGSGRTVRVQS